MKSKDKTCIDCYPDRELEKVINSLTKKDALALLTRIAPIQHKIVEVLDVNNRPSFTKTYKVLDEANNEICKIVEYLQIRAITEDKK